MSKDYFFANVLRSFAISCLVVSGAGSLTWCQEIDAELLNRFRTEAPQAWAATSRSQLKYFNSNSGWSIDSEIKGFTTYFDGRVMERDWKGTLKRRGRTYVSRSIIEPRENTESLTGINPQYLFKLSRPIGSQRWLLTGVFQRDCDLPSDDWFKLGRDEIDSDSEYLHVLHELQPVANDSHLCPLSFPKIGWFDLRELQFKLISNEMLRDNEVVKVVVTFSQKFYYPGDKPPSEKSYLCTAFFDPDRNWSLVRAEGWFVEKDGRRTRPFSYLDKEFEKDVGGCPFQTSLEQKDSAQPLGDDSDSLKRLSSIKSEIEFEQFETGEFFLSAFGLPEPDWYIPPRPWWLYASLTGMGLLLAGALLLRYGKQLWNRN